MAKVIIDPSIATLLEIKPIGSKEKRPVIFTADENWPGLYTLRIWNASNKVTEFTIPNDALSVVDNVMTWWLWPENQSLTASKYYAEIYSDEFSSIIYKAEFEILK